MPGSQESTNPVIEARMTKFNDGHIGWCAAESVIRAYGDTMDLFTLLKAE